LSAGGGCGSERYGGEECRGGEKSFESVHHVGGPVGCFQVRWEVRGRLRRRREPSGAGAATIRALGVRFRCRACLSADPYDFNATRWGGVVSEQ
jgi:hypothetical protein